MTAPIQPAPLNQPPQVARKNSVAGRDFGSVLSSVSELPTPEKMGEKIAVSVRTAAARYNLPEPLILAVIKQESNFDPSAKSPAGAIGMMQLMPETARAMGVNDPTDPTQNIDGGSRYLRQMIDRFDGDLPKAIAAYNCGPDRVAQNGGIPPIEETQKYVPAVLGFFADYQGVRNLQAAVTVALSQPAPLDLHLKRDFSDDDPPPPPPNVVMTRV